eukprot:SAG31_NODE_10261_length_1163_cov_1.529135_1_plen_310_part_00
MIAAAWGAHPTYGLTSLSSSLLLLLLLRVCRCCCCLCGWGNAAAAALDVALVATAAAVPALRRSPADDPGIAMNAGHLPQTPRQAIPQLLSYQPRTTAFGRSQATRDQLSTHHSNRHTCVLTLDAANRQAATSSLPYIRPGHGVNATSCFAIIRLRPAAADLTLILRCLRALQCGHLRLRASTTSPLSWRKTRRARITADNTTTRRHRRCCRYAIYQTISAHLVASDRAVWNGTFVGAPSAAVAADACAASNGGAGVRSSALRGRVHFSARAAGGQIQACKANHGAFRKVRRHNQAGKDQSCCLLRGCI